MLAIHIPLLLMSTAGRMLRCLSQTYRPCIIPVPSSRSGTSDVAGKRIKRVYHSYDYSTSQLILIVQLVNKPPTNAGDTRNVGSIPGSGRSPGGESGNPLQDSCLMNPMGREAWQARVHGVAKRWSRWCMDIADSESLKWEIIPEKPSLLDKQFLNR